jgi:hypothetical protein
VSTRAVLASAIGPAGSQIAGGAVLVIGAFVIARHRAAQAQAREP